MTIRVNGKMGRVNLPNGPRVPAYIRATRHLRGPNGPLGSPGPTGPSGPVWEPSAVDQLANLAVKMKVEELFARVSLEDSMLGVLDLMRANAEFEEILVPDGAVDQLATVVRDGATGVASTALGRYADYEEMDAYPEIALGFYADDAEEISAVDQLAALVPKPGLFTRGARILREHFAKMRLGDAVGRTPA